VILIKIKTVDDLQKKEAQVRLPHTEAFNLKNLCNNYAFNF